MKKLLIALVALVGMVIAPACATFKNADGSVNVKGIINDARWGVLEACSVEYLPAQTCVVAEDAFAVADGIIDQNVGNTGAAVKQLLQHVQADLPADSRLRPYLGAAIVLLAG